MKFNTEKISINYVLGQNKLFQFFLHSFLLFSFKVIRLIKKLFAYNTDRVVVISLNKLGDTVFTVPAIRALHEKYGDNLWVVCYPESVPVYKLEFERMNFCELVNNQFYFSERIAKPEAKRKLKEIKPSLIVDLTCTMKSAALIYSIRAKTIIGSNGDQFKTIYDLFTKYRNKPRLMDIYLDVVQLILDISEPREKVIANPQVKKHYGKIFIQPFAGWKEKEWNLKKFINIAVILKQKFSVSIIIQKGQLSPDVINEIENSNIEVIQTKSVDHLIECIKEASLFIGNDSGPINIANYLNKPTLTIFGATNYDYVAPKYEHQKNIQFELKCSPKNDEKFCAIGIMNFKCSGIQCMNLLSEEMVNNSIDVLTKEYC